MSLHFAVSLRPQPFPWAALSFASATSSTVFLQHIEMLLIHASGKTQVGGRKVMLYLPNVSRIQCKLLYLPLLNRKHLEGYKEKKYINTFQKHVIFFPSTKQKISVLFFLLQFSLDFIVILKFIFYFSSLICAFPMIKEFHFLQKLFVLISLSLL